MFWELHGHSKNNCIMISGAIDALGSQKTAKFLNLCNHFGCESNFYTSSIWLTGVPFSLPIINLVDQPGFAIGMYGSSHPTAPALIFYLRINGRAYCYHPTRRLSHGCSIPSNDPYIYRHPPSCFWRGGRCICRSQRRGNGACLLVSHHCAIMCHLNSFP